MCHKEPRTFMETRCSLEKSQQSSEDPWGWMRGGGGGGDWTPAPILSLIISFRPVQSLQVENSIF